MSSENLALILAIVTAFFSGLAVSLRLIYQISKQIRINTGHIAENTRRINGSTKVPPGRNPSG